MKRLIVLTAVLMIVFSCIGNSAYAQNKEIEVVIPDYKVIIDNASVYYADSLYPFLNYKGVTYLPLTYGYARAMNLTTGWLEGSSFMVAYHPSDARLPVYETTKNKKNNTAVIPSGYKIYVNGKKINNLNEEYPMINFRGVTYLPLTWKNAVENFGWKLSFENNVFTIETDEYSGKNWNLSEIRKDDAVFDTSYDMEIPLGGGAFTSKWVTEFKSVDFKTGNVSKLDTYIPPEETYNKNTNVDIEIKNGYAYYKDQKLKEVFINELSDDYVKPEDVENFEYSVTAGEGNIYDPLNVVTVFLHTTTTKKDVAYGRSESYTYIRVDDKLVFLGMHRSVESVYTLGDDIYFNTVDYLKTIMSHFKQNKKMWKLSKDGNLTEVKYGDYNSIKIIGKANNKLYLKCLWAPEDNLEDGAYSVSLVNDGYYTWDGEGIKFISPYVYSDYDVVSEDGDILAVNNKINKVTKCEINPEYY